VDSKRDTARQQFSEASALAKEGEWSAALSRYRDSFALYPHATTLFNVGFCLGKLGDRLAALRVTTAALDSRGFYADRSLQPERRRVAEAQVLALQAQLAQVIFSGGEVLAVTVDGAPTTTLDGMSPAVHVPKGATLPELAGRDDEPVSEPPRAVIVLPGPHRVAVRTTRGWQSFDVSPLAGEQHHLKLDLVTVPPVTVPTATTRAPEHAAPERRSVNWRNAAGFGALAVGGAGLGLAAVFGVMARNADAQLAEACRVDLACEPEQQDTIQRYRRSVTWANVGLIAGVVGVSAGVSILLLVPSSPPEAKVALDVYPNGATLTHSF
jgi:hypothetical protein